MSSPAPILDQDLVIIRAILNAHLPKGAAVWVFGSRAHGTLKRGADLDLAVDAGRPLTRSESGALADAFEDSDLPYPVDVVDVQAASEGFRAIIEKDRWAGVSFEIHGASPDAPMP